MKSVKPGRGPSFMGGIMGIAMGAFGVIWIAIAASIGAPALFCAFGGIFVLVAIISAVYNFMNATQKNRFSAFDITDDGEEPDPLNRKYGDNDSKFCPYCGEKVDGDYKYCRKCGKELP